MISRQFVMKATVSLEVIVQRIGGLSILCFADFLMEVKPTSS